MLSKQQLRHAFRLNLERSLEGEDARGLFEASSRGLALRLKDFLSSHSGLWGGFQPFGFEPSISHIFNETPHINWAFPRVEGESLRFYVSHAHDMVPNQWGILEPDPQRSKPVSVAEMSGLLVPGLAFDLDCNRLGRGRGFYDRLFAEVNHHNLLKVGVAQERQIASQLPIDPHDQAMDRVMTESRLIERKAS